MITGIIIDNMKRIVLWNMLKENLIFVIVMKK